MIKSHFNLHPCYKPPVLVAIFAAMIIKEVGILGATGFTGGELVGLLLRHPQVKIAWLSSESQPGGYYGKIYPQYLGFLSPDADKMKSFDEVKSTQPDVVFSCLPHGASAKCVVPFLENGKTHVIDLSADFRVKDPDVFATAYGHAHPLPEKLSTSFYGLSEIYAAKILNAKLIANPGCYPTSVLLPLFPLIRDGLVSSKGIIIDSKSGVSGAGKKATETTHYINANENVAAYAIGDSHRHRLEINEQLSFAAESNVEVLFTPHLIPMERGILSTIYVDLKSGIDETAVVACLKKQYADSDFVRIRDDLPRTGDVKHTNLCHIKAYQPKGSQKLILVSVIDNMVKGASGQALQNMNLIFGFSPRLGLT